MNAVGQKKYNVVKALITSPNIDINHQSDKGIYKSINFKQHHCILQLKKAILKWLKYYYLFQI